MQHADLSRRKFLGAATLGAVTAASRAAKSWT